METELQSAIEDARTASMVCRVNGLTKREDVYKRLLRSTDFEKAVVDQAMITECVTVANRAPADVLHDIIQWHIAMDRVERAKPVAWMSLEYDQNATDPTVLFAERAEDLYPATITPLYLNAATQGDPVAFMYDIVYDMDTPTPTRFFVEIDKKQPVVADWEISRVVTPVYAGLPLVPGVKS